MKALLIDDERLARDQLRRLLREFPAVEIAGEAGNAGEAKEKIAALAPDLLFLDIQMPGTSGMELMAALDPPVPSVIFTTAFDEYAVKAFELNALDYLLKPIEPARLAAALDRVRQRAQGVTGLRPPDGAFSSRLGLADNVFVRDGDRCWFIHVRQIRLLERDGGYTRVHFEDARPLLFRSLNAMEERLDPRHFFRANRTQIINLDWIERIEPWFSGGLKVHLKGGVTVEISRRQAQKFREQSSL